MKTPILYILSGTSLSGKSTFAKQMVERDDNLRIVNRDKIRELLYGYTEDNVWRHYEDKNFIQREKEVSKFQSDAIRALIAQGFDVIVDNTFLRESYIDKLVKEFYYCIIKFHLVEASWDTCIARNEGRRRKISEDVLKKQFNELKSLKNDFDFKTYYPMIRQFGENPNLERCITFDIDGTLALSLSGRNIYDSSRVLEDTLSEEIFHVYNAFKAQGFHIIICTGRNKEAEEDTKLWLLNHGIEYDEFHCRRDGDQRKDYIIKEEMWRDIATRYNIFMQIDDRDSVVNHGRLLGLKVLQVAAGSF